MLYIVILYALLASTFTFGKIALLYATPYFLIAFRMLVAACLLLGYSRYAQGSFSAIKKADWSLFLYTALMYIYIPFLLEFWALQYVSSIKTNIIFSAAPFVSAICAYFLEKHRLTRLQIGALCMGFAGLLPVLINSSGDFKQIHTFFLISIPEAALIISMLSGSYAWFLIKKLNRHHYSLMIINGVTMGIGGLLMAATSMLIDVLIPWFYVQQIRPVTNIHLFLFWALVLVIIANIIFYPLYGWLLKRYSVTFLSFCGFLSPIFGAFLGWFFIGEQVTWNHLISLLCIIVALFLFYKEEKLQ